MELKPHQIFLDASMRIETEVLDTQSFSSDGGCRFILPKRGFLDCSKTYLLAQALVNGTVSAAGGGAYPMFTGGHALVREVHFRIGGQEICANLDHAAFRTAVGRGPTMSAQTGLKAPFDRSQPHMEYDAATGLVQFDQPEAGSFINAYATLTDNATSSPKAALALSDLHPFFRDIKVLPLALMNGQVEIELVWNTDTGVTFDPATAGGDRTYTIQRPQLFTELLFPSDMSRMKRSYSQGYWDIYHVNGSVAAGVANTQQTSVQYLGAQGRTLGQFFLVKEIAAQLPVGASSYWMPGEELQLRVGERPLWEQDLTNVALQYQYWKEAVAAFGEGGFCPVPKGVYDGSNAALEANQYIQSSVNVLGVDLLNMSSGNSPVQVTWSRTPNATAHTVLAVSLKSFITYARTFVLEDGEVKILE